MYWLLVYKPKMNRIFFGNLALICWCFVGCNQANTFQPSFEIYAHRGFRGLHPENTIQAMKKALEYGAILELDLAITRDKQVVISHDPVLNRKITVDASGKPLPENERYTIYQMEYEQVKSFDVGEKPNPDFPEQERYRAHIPLLNALIDSIEAYASLKKLDSPYYFMETKLNAKTDGVNHPEPEEFVDLMMQVVDEKKIRNRIIVQSFDPRTLQILRQKYPEVKVAFLAKNNTLLADNIAWLGFNPDYYSINAAYIDAGLIAQCNAMDIELIVGNCNDYEEIERISGLGVYRFISDFPITYLMGKQGDRRN